MCRKSSKCNCLFIIVLLLTRKFSTFVPASRYTNYQCFCIKVFSLLTISVRQHLECILVLLNKSKRNQKNCCLFVDVCFFNVQYKMYDVLQFLYGHRLTVQKGVLLLNQKETTMMMGKMIRARLDPRKNRDPHVIVKLLMVLLMVLLIVPLLVPLLTVLVKRIRLVCVCARARARVFVCHA